MLDSPQETAAPVQPGLHLSPQALVLHPTTLFSKFSNRTCLSCRRSARLLASPLSRGLSLLHSTRFLPGPKHSSLPQGLCMCRYAWSALLSLLHLVCSDSHLARTPSLMLSDPVAHLRPTSPSQPTAPAQRCAQHLSNPLYYQLPEEADPLPQCCQAAMLGSSTFRFACNKKVASMWMPHTHNHLTAIPKSKKCWKTEVFHTCLA